MLDFRMDQANLAHQMSHVHFCCSMIFCVSYLFIRHPLQYIHHKRRLTLDDFHVLQPMVITMGIVSQSPKHIQPARRPMFGKFKYSTAIPIIRTTMA